MLYQYTVHIFFATIVMSVAGYLIGLVKKSEEWLRAGRYLFYSAGIFIGAIYGIHLYLIFTHRFEFTYIWQHTSRELSSPLLFASSYAGQEGSFLLWALWTAVVGFPLIAYTRRRNIEASVMLWYGSAFAFLGLLIIAKNPFAYVWETFANDGVQYGMIPPNGKGLNPLLHNLWITIHPPILFLGFTAMLVPYAFAMSALTMRNYKQWISAAFPWVLFAAAVLGCGIMLGGFWAYETLGWGGFWGWDPVENSSLVPWIISVILIHTMLVQKQAGGLFKTNIIMAAASYLFVLYSTFLTRSGVLGDTSVHSFVDPGYFAYILLLSGIAGFTFVTALFLFLRRKDLQAQTFHAHWSAKEFWIGLGIIVLTAIATVVLVGTSWPILLDLLGQTKIAIDTEFYNQVNLPLMILFFVINAVSIKFYWKRESNRKIFHHILFAAIASFLITIVFILLTSAIELGLTILLFTALFAFILNASELFRFLKRKPSAIGLYLAHLGVAVLIVGVVISSQFQKIIHLRLPQNEAVQALGYTFTYTKREQLEKNLRDREKYAYHIVTQSGNDTVLLKPILYWSAYNNWESAFLEPGISWGIRADLYIAPKAVEEEGNPVTVRLKKGESIPHPFDSSWTITFRAFDMTKAQNAMGNQAIQLGAKIFCMQENTSTEIDTTVWATLRGQRWSSEPVQIPGSPLYVRLLQILPNREDLSQSQIEMSFWSTKVPSSIPKEIFIAEISYKPLMIFVWFGAILTVVGLLLSSINRLRLSLQRMIDRKEEFANQPTATVIE